MILPLPILAAVLFGAFCNAAWNMFVKRGTDPLGGIVLVTAGCGILAAVALPFLPAPAPASWPFIAASCATQFVYVFALAAAYQAGDLGQAYPVMRGVAPLIVALASGPVIGERLSVGRWCGVGLISAGVLAMAFVPSGPGAPRSGHALVFALVTSVTIATYTVLDGIGVRRSGAPLSYAFTTFVITPLPLLAWAALSRGRAFAREAAAQWRMVAFGGVGSFLSYGIALWAFTHAPVAVIASLRETSILFATALSILVLKEGIVPARLAATGLIVVGAVVIRAL